MCSFRRGGVNYEITGLLGTKLRELATGCRAAGIRTAAMAAALAAPAEGLRAQSPGAPADPNPNRTVTVNYVYAANLGFGGYSLAGLDANVFTLPLGYTFPLGIGQDWKIRLTLPVQLGLYEFRATDTNGSRIKINQQSLAILPGLELQVPLTQRTMLKPFAQVGVGHSFGAGSGSDALFYTAGLRAVTQWRAGQYTLSLGNAVLYTGETTSNADESYAAIETGFEVRRPLGFTVGGIEPDLGIYAAHYYYPKPLRFSRFLRNPLKVSNQGEIGFSIGPAKPFDMPIVAPIRNARIGVGYVTGDGLSVWHVNFGFPF